jgi:membrane-bound lytic murein transglycosylase B
MTRAITTLLALWFACAAVSTGARASSSYAERPEVREFVRQLTERHGFIEPELLQLFSRIKPSEGVLQAIRPQPAGARSWEDYRAIFVNERRTAAGLEFWEAHRETLERAQRTFGVPQEIAVAIIGVETFYGRNTGRWRVVEALATLAFDYGPRAKYFRGELENFLLLARDTELDVFSVRGSFAGAIGIPQFMPGSVRRYAVDFDGDGRVDLRGNAVDAIGSVGNFLKEHGWQTGEPVLFAARVEGEGYRRYADGSVTPRHTLGELIRAGVEPAGDTRALQQARAVLIELSTPQRPSEYRIGLHNFWVITRYNRSAFYATAVVDLAERLRAARR